jgi:hypothetical protein
MPFSNIFRAPAFFGAHRTCVSAVCTLLCSANLAWSNPFETGDADPAATAELKSGLSWQSSPTEDTWVAPNVELTLPVAAKLEATVAVNYGRVDHRHEKKRSGLHDMLVATKWQFAGTDDSWRLAVEPALSIPTGDEDKGLGSGAWQLELPLFASRQYGAVGVNGKFGVRRAFGRDEDAIVAGGMATLALSDSVEIGAEIVGDTLVDDSDAYHLRGNIGFVWQLTPAASVQGLAGKTIENRHGDRIEQARLIFEYRF